MKRYKWAMDQLAKVVYFITGTMLSAMVLIITWQVFSRFVLNAQPFWSEETTLVLMLYVGFLGAAVTYRNRMHIGIKFFVDSFKDPTKARLYFVIDLLLTGFAVFMIIWGTELVSRMMNQTLPALKIKVGYAYMAMPIGGSVLLLFIIEKIAMDVTKFKEGE